VHHNLLLWVIQKFGSQVRDGNRCWDDEIQSGIVQCRKRSVSYGLLAERQVCEQFFLFVKFLDNINQFLFPQSCIQFQFS
jgi:hypothetical protein